MKHELVYSAMVTPDGTVLESLHRHDFVTHIDKKTDKMYMLDGGLDYVRSSCHRDQIFIQVYADEPFERVRQYAYRIERQNGSGPFIRVPICQLSDARLLELIDELSIKLNDRDKLSNTHYRLLALENSFRKSNAEH